MNQVIDDAFLGRYRELLDAEDASFDALEHAVEDGDRERYEVDLALWRDAITRRFAFLERHGLVGPTVTVS